MIEGWIHMDEKANIYIPRRGLDVRGAINSSAKKRMRERKRGGTFGGGSFSPVIMSTKG